MSTRTATPKADVGTTFPTRNDIPADSRTKLVSLLNQQLADTFDLVSQTKFAHWNVKGPSFIALHKLFDKLADTLREHVDEIAERATALGGVAMGTVRQAAAMSHTPEFPTGTFKDMAVVTALAERYAAVGKATREAIHKATDLGDQDTMDLFVEVSRDLDQSLYFLEAHLQG
jgi:starvation-inducible DNA-binding protein